jgi:hypothetical protein
MQHRVIPGATKEKSSYPAKKPQIIYFTHYKPIMALLHLREPVTTRAHINLTLTFPALAQYHCPGTPHLLFINYRNQT